MQLLTDLGYKNIDDCVIGDKLIAYDINDGHLIINELEKKEWFSPDIFEDEWSIPEQIVDEDGNLVFDEDGNPVMTESVLVKTKKQIFEDTYGELKFLKINNWTLFKNQSVWANLRVVHASEVEIGDIVYDDSDNDVEVTSIEEVEVDGWWRLTVSGDHSYIADNLTLHNASRYWVGGGASANWNATGNTNWGSASGVQDNASVPTSTDDVTFDGAGTGGNSNSTISATITILSLNITTGYTSTMTHNAVLTIGGNWTYTGNYTIAGTSAITLALATQTITSNGITWPNPLTFSSGTKTLIGNFTVSGFVTFNNGNTSINSTTSETITFSGGISLTQSLLGTAKVILTGGTWSAGTNQHISNKLDIQGNVTLSGVVEYRGAEFTYISGTITTTGSTLLFGNANTTITSGILTFAGVRFGGGIKTLIGNLNVNGLFDLSAGTTVNKTTSEVINANGGININRDLSGTAKVILKGGTWSGSNLYTLINNLDIDGNVTVSGNVLTGSSNTITYISGTITTTGSTLIIQYGSTLNTSAISWNNVTLFGGTVTLTSDLNVYGLLRSDSTNNTVNKTTSEQVNAYGGLTMVSGLLGTAKVILKGGTWSGGGTVTSNLDIDGNVTVSGGVVSQSPILTYISGTVTTTESTLSLTGSITTTLNTNGITWNNISLTASSTRNLTSNLSMSGLLTISGSTTINRTTSETVTVGGGLTINNTLSGTADIYLTGGVWGGNNVISNNLYINGNIIISGIVAKGGSGETLRILSGTVKSINAGLRLTTSQTLNKFFRVPFVSVTITAGTTQTLDRFFTGTPSQICQVSSTGANYTIAFQDGFEKMARNVAISGATLSRPNQLLVINNSRFNTNRGTNIGIRYYNQSPNGVPRNVPSINDTMTAPAMGLVADPNFIKQG